MKRYILFAVLLVFGSVILMGIGQINNPGGGGSGTVSNCGTVGGLGYYSATGTAIGCDANITDNGSGIVTLGTGGQIEAANSCAAPGYSFAAGATSGFCSSAAGTAGISISGSESFHVGTGIAELGQNTVYGWGSGGSSSTTDTGLSRDSASGIVAVGTGAAQSEAGFLRWNNCKPTAVNLSSGSFTTFCSWTLPAVAKTWAFQCSGTYTLTAGTTPTLIIGFIAAQTPSAVAVTASIGSTLTGVSTQGTNTTANTSQQTVLTGTTNTQANAPFAIYGSVTSSATSGTFILNAELGGSVSPAGTINFGSSCEIF